MNDNYLLHQLEILVCEKWFAHPVAYSMVGMSKDDGYITERGLIYFVQLRTNLLITYGFLGSKVMLRKNSNKISIGITENS